MPGQNKARFEAAFREIKRFKCWEFLKTHSWFIFLHGFGANVQLRVGFNSGDMITSQCVSQSLWRHLVIISILRVVFAARENVRLCMLKSLTKRLHPCGGIQRNLTRQRNPVLFFSSSLIQ